MHRYRRTSVKKDFIFYSPHMHLQWTIHFQRTAIQFFIEKTGDHGELPQSDQCVTARAVDEGIIKTVKEAKSLIQEQVKQSRPDTTMRMQQMKQTKASSVGDVYGLPRAKPMPIYLYEMNGTHD